MNKVLHKTGGLCPTCLKELPAEVYADGDGVVWMTRTCPEHGQLDNRVWPDADHYMWLRSEAFPEKTRPQKTRNRCATRARSGAERARGAKGAGRCSR